MSSNNNPNSYRRMPNFNTHQMRPIPLYARQQQPPQQAGLPTSKSHAPVPRKTTPAPAQNSRPTPKRPINHVRAPQQQQQQQQQRAAPIAHKRPHDHVVHSSTSEFPSSCPWCDSPLQSVASCAQHVGGKNHRKQVAAVLSAMPAVKRAKTAGAPMSGGVQHRLFETVEEMWADADALQLHVDHGFDVDLLQDREAIEGRTDSLRAMALLQPPDIDWVKTEKRWVVTWNGHPQRGPNSMMPLTVAPSVADIKKRLFHDGPPPKVNIPRGGFPQSLPIAKEKLLRMMWPNEPNSRLSLGVLDHNQIPITDMDVVANTAFIYACTGDGSYTKETFYLQWYKGTTLCVLYVPKSKVWSLDSAGHRVEQLITDDPPLVARAGNQRRSHHAISVLNIGDYRVCLTSEIDAHDSANMSTAANNLVEIKSSRKGIQSMLGVHACTQIACNGSQKVVCCHIDSDNKRVTHIETLKRKEVHERWEDGFVYAGQRARTVIDIILNADEVLNAIVDNSVVKMTFDEGKAPVFEQAPCSVVVIPDDL